MSNPVSGPQSRSDGTQKALEPPILPGEFPSPDEPGPDKVQVIVSCPRREGFPGYWCARIFFAHGKTKRWVTTRDERDAEGKLVRAAELQQIEADPVLALVTASDAASLASELGADMVPASEFKALQGEFDRLNDELAQAKAKLEAQASGSPQMVNETASDGGGDAPTTKRAGGRSPNQPSGSK